MSFPIDLLDRFMFIFSFQEHLCEQRLPATEISSLLDIIGMACDNVSFDVQLTRNAVLTQVCKILLVQFQKC